MIKKSRIKGLIFDLDGTLTLTQHFHYLAFSKVFKRYGMRYTKHDDLYKYAGKGSKIIFPEVFKSFGKKLTQEEVQRLANEKKEIYNKVIETHAITPVKGVKKILKKLKKRGIKMCVASGNRLEFIKKLLREAGIYHYFKFIVTNKDVKRSKPAPDIFLAAAKKMGLRPRECAVFEDAVNGVLAARKGGMRCIALTTGLQKKDLEKAGATYVVKDFTKVTDDMLA